MDDIDRVHPMTQIVGVSILQVLILAFMGASMSLINYFFS